MLISARDLHLIRGNAPVLDGATFHVSERERVGLVGVNGSGKSSLLRLVTNELEADSGELSRRRRLRVASVSQFLPESMVTQPVMQVAGELLAPGESDHLPHELLTRLGFSSVELSKKAGELSGGWVGRLLLVRAVASKPDLLLLDEPTNHLDVRSVLAFQQFLTTHVRCAFVLVSHDRALLDAVTARTLYLRGGQIQAFDLPFSRAREAMLKKAADTLTRIKAEERRIDELKASQKRLARWGREHDNEKFSRRAKSMAKNIEKLEANKEDKPFEDRRQLALADGDLRAKRVIDIEGYAVTAPDDRLLFDISRLHIARGDRLLILGDNGTGKTIFIGHLRRAFDALHAGRDVPGFRINLQATLGYYDQALSTLDLDTSLFDTMSQHTRLKDTRIRSRLVKAGFPVLSHDRPLREFSGGERSRVYFLLMRQARPSLLVLDEPTNHLDVEGCEVLERELVEKNATLVLVSHDRSFARAVANRFVLIQNGVLEEVFDLDAYYRSLERATFSESGAHIDDSPAVVTTDHEVMSEDQSLERILELEALLEADQARKPKHQKPDRQVQWKRELEALYSALD